MRVESIVGMPKGNTTRNQSLGHTGTDKKIKGKYPGTKITYSIVGTIRKWYSNRKETL